jgi:acyl carrier protein
MYLIYFYVRIQGGQRQSVDMDSPDQEKNSLLGQTSDIQQALLEITLEYLAENGYTSSIHPNIRFSSTGMDSLDLMMLAERISSVLGIEMELTALIDYPNIDALSGHIQSLIHEPENISNQIGMHFSNCAPRCPTKTACLSRV